MKQFPSKSKNFHQIVFHFIDGADTSIEKGLIYLLRTL